MLMALYINVDKVGVGAELGNSTLVNVPITTLYMDQPTGTNSVTLRSGSNIFNGELVNTDGSSLAYKEINRARFLIGKTGSPSGTVYVGVWSGIVTPTSSNYKFLIGQKPASEFSTTAYTYQFTRNDTTTYLLQPKDIIGVYFDSGDASNNIAVYQNGTASTFDSTNSEQATYSGSWTASATTDIRGQISLSQPMINEQQEQADFSVSANGFQLKGYLLLMFAMVVVVSGFEFFYERGQK